MARWDEERGVWGDRGRWGEEGRDERDRERWRGEERWGRGRWDEPGGGRREELRPGERRTYSARGEERYGRGDEGWGRGREEGWRGREEGGAWGREREDRGAEGWSDEDRDRRWSMGGERGGWRSEGDRGDWRDRMRDRWGEGRRDEGWRGESDAFRTAGGSAMDRDWWRSQDRGGGWAGGSGERGRRDWGRESRAWSGEGGDRGPMERVADRMREGWDRLTGKGPKGFKRSDERIRDDVCERISRSGVNAENVEVKVENGEVTLTGEVEHREDKRMLEDLAEDVFGVDEVHNQTRVRRAQAQVGGATAGLPGYQQSQAGQPAQPLQTPGTTQQGQGQSQGGQRTQPGGGMPTGGRH